MVAPMSKRFVEAIERFVTTEGVDLITFEKGQRKDDVAQQYLARFTGDEGVLFVGKAQEKARIFRTEKRRDARGGLPQMAASTPASVRRGAPGGRLSVSALGAASRVRVDPGPRSAAHRTVFLRRSDPGESRPRSSRSHAIDLQPPRHTPHARPLPHPRVDRGRRAVAPRGLQKVQGQAVPQRRAGPSHRNHHQRHLRFRDRSRAPQSARLAGDRLCCQPTVVTRRIFEPRLPDRRRPLARRYLPRPRRRSTRRRPPLRRPPRPRAHARTVSLRPRPHRLSPSGVA